MHIPPFDNRNKAIVDLEDAHVPLVYFNIVKLKSGEMFDYRVDGYETCIVPATGTVTVEVAGQSFTEIGNRGSDVWDGEPEGVYVPTDTGARITARTDTETFIAGAKYGETLTPFAVRSGDLDLVQYGSDDTKTHRKINTYLAQRIMTVLGACWSVSCLRSAPAAGLAFLRTNTTQIGCRMRRVTMNAIIFASSQIMDQACKCFSGSTTSPATPITS